MHLFINKFLNRSEPIKYQPIKMKNEELIALLKLQSIHGIGDVTLKKLIQTCGSAQQVLQESEIVLESIEGIGKSTAWAIKNKIDVQKAEHELEFILKNNIQAVSFKEENYPERLKHCYDGPVLLFTQGDIQWQNQKVISIVGTRNITNYGVEFCQKLVQDLLPFNPIIVSGFAFGVDITAHAAAIHHQLQTVGVLAHGMYDIFPKSNKKYAPKMLENGGFITDFWSTVIPAPENFVKRNRIVAGISEATIVIESAEKGGSMITANLANDYSREVFAVPGRASDIHSQGCNKLIKTNKAHLLTDVADLVYMLNWDAKSAPSKPVQKQLFVDLEPAEQKVYDYLNQQGKTLMDLISLECEIPIYKLSSMLLTMELKGLIKPLPGKLFEAV